MENDVLIATVGGTDPIRGDFDGPVLHIVRYYKPWKVYLVLTEEMAGTEKVYHQNETAIHLLYPDCEVEIIETGVRDAHSYDAFADIFLNICNKVRDAHPDNRILLNITSGTPQMETALCMTAISDDSRFYPIQVLSPEQRLNRAPRFKPEEDLVEEWFEDDLDNLDEAKTRCRVPQLLNFRRPIVQMQIISLIENYDYSGAYQLYEKSKENFSEKVGKLLKHADMRVNLKDKEARTLAKELEMENELYPVKRTDINSLVDFFNSMKIKQFRGELNDLSMRLEIMAEFFGIHMLENRMKISLDAICTKRKVKNSYIYTPCADKCEEKMPGVNEYLDMQYPNFGYKWGSPLNASTVVHFTAFLSKIPQYQKYEEYTAEMMKWVELSAAVRNPAAHSIVAITEDMIRECYGGSSSELCRRMKHVLEQVFGTEARKDAFDIYNTINERVKYEMEASYESDAV